MKKLVTLFFALVAFFGFVLTAAAVPTTWTDTIDFNPNVLIPPAYTYTHDITDDGYTGYLMGGDDLIDSYSLSVSLKDDKNDGIFDCAEFAIIDQPGYIADGGVLNFNYANVTLGWSFAGLLSLNMDGQLKVTVSSLWGDFLLDSSKLVAYGDNGNSTAPVPEPATMLLLGSGLLGLAASRRKRSTKNMDLK